MALFLDIADFTAQFDLSLTAAQTAVATRLLQVASDRISSLKSDVDPTAAAQVVFEITRDAMLYGDFEALSEFTNTTSRRTEAGTFDPTWKAVNDLLSDRHKRLLGIPLRAGPVGSFPTACPVPQSRWLDPFI